MLAAQRARVHPPAVRPLHRSALPPSGNSSLISPMASMELVLTASPSAQGTVPSIPAWWLEQGVRTLRWLPTAPPAAHRM